MVFVNEEKKNDEVEAYSWILSLKHYTQSKISISMNSSLRL